MSGLNCRPTLWQGAEESPHRLEGGSHADLRDHPGGKSLCSGAGQRDKLAESKVQVPG